MSLPEPIEKRPMVAFAASPAKYVRDSVLTGLVLSILRLVRFTEKGGTEMARLGSILLTQSLWWTTFSVAWWCFNRLLRDELAPEHRARLWNTVTVLYVVSVFTKAAIDYFDPDYSHDIPRLLSTEGSMQLILLLVVWAFALFRKKKDLKKMTAITS